MRRPGREDALTDRYDPTSLMATLKKIIFVPLMVLGQDWWTKDSLRHIPVTCFGIGYTVCSIFISFKRIVDALRAWMLNKFDLRQILDARFDVKGI